MSYVFGPQAFVANVSIDKKELGDRNDGNDGKVRTSAFYRCIPIGMHGQTCVFLANLTAFSLKEKCASRVFHGQEGARTELEVLVEETRVCVRHRHVKFGLSLVSWMENVFALQDLRSLLAAGALGPGERRGGRPTHPVLAHAREWWGFAVTCVLLRYRKDAARLRLDAVRCSVQRCKQYIELYERKSCEGRPWLRELSSKEMRRVSDIETHPDTHFRELVVWRCIAWERLCAADAEHRQQQSKRSKKKDEVQYRMTREQLKMLDGGGNSPGC
jgi:hypothetical protein